MSSVTLPIPSSSSADLTHSRLSTKPTAKATATDSSDPTSQTSVTALGSTFLKLLTQELQNQDPTAPMDSTQMVGQMISLNQLDQLASINQLLTNQFGAATSSSSTSSSSTGAAESPSRAQAYAAAVQAALSGLNAGTAMSSSANPTTSSLL